MPAEETGLAESQVTALQNLPPHLAILKLENDTIQAMAVARPRDHKAILADVKEQLEAYPEFAKSAIYNKPVGVVWKIVCKCGERFEVSYIPKDGLTCPKCDGSVMASKKKIKKFARNLSIRTAESLAEAYGYNRVRSDVTLVDEDTVRVEATFTDYQRGRIWQDSGLLSKVYKDWRGKMKRTPDDRFFNVVVKGEASKRIREVILRSLPAGLKLEVRAAAEAKLEESLSDSDIDKIITSFAKKGVTVEMLEAHIGQPRQVGWTQQDRLNLVGIWNAVEDGETTLREAFGSDDEAPQSSRQPEAKPDQSQAEAMAGELAAKAASQEEKPAAMEQPQAAAAPPPEPAVKANVLGDTGVEREYRDAITAATTLKAINDTDRMAGGDDRLTGALRQKIAVACAVRREEVRSARRGRSSDASQDAGMFLEGDGGGE